jgi:transcription initiation factor TFIIB
MTKTQLDIEDGRTEDEKSVTESQPLSSCPECDGQIVHDDEHGETTCVECGLVLDENSIDRGPEWRAFHSDEKDEKSRVGAPTTQLMHDKGLSTTISWQDKDAYGRSVSSRKRARLQRLRTWDERFRTKDAHERNLK